MTELTTLEQEVLIDITRDNFYEEAFESTIWTDCFLDCCRTPIKQARAILVSLKKKEMIEVSGGRDGGIAIRQSLKKRSKVNADGQGFGPVNAASWSKAQPL